MKIFTLEELKEFNGQKGKPAYIAFQGKVYDVSDGIAWDEGDHFGQHEAGMDLTEEFEDAPHGEEVFADMPVVGELAG